MEFYTNIWLNRGKIYAKGVKNGRAHKEICSYSPYLFTPTQSKTQFKTLDNRYVEKKNFNTISQARQYLKTYDEVEGYPIYGLPNFQYMYIYDYFSGTINFDVDKISVVGLDIENKM